MQSAALQIGGGFDVEFRMTGGDGAMGWRFRRAEHDERHNRNRNRKSVEKGTDKE
jgi:hypothetical protein